MMRNISALWFFPVFALVAAPVFAATISMAPDRYVDRKQGGAWVYYAFDQQGNVAQRLNASGTVLNSSTYDAYGNEDLEGSTQNDPWAYNAQWGYYLDRDTGLYYCQNRWYDPATGRWLNRDPISYGGGANLYSYCGGGPIGAADPSGTFRDSVTRSLAADPVGTLETLELAGYGSNAAARAAAAAGALALPALAGDGEAGDSTDTRRRRRKQPIYRLVHCEEAIPMGRSWSYEDPREDPENYAYRYGVPPHNPAAPVGRRGNRGTFVQVGIWNGLGAEIRPALGLPDYPGSGGSPEIFFPLGPGGFVIPAGPPLPVSPPITIRRRP